jgi:hypothetical protein
MPTTFADRGLKCKDAIRNTNQSLLIALIPAAWLKREVQVVDWTAVENHPGNIPFCVAIIKTATKVAVFHQG